MSNHYVIIFNEISFIVYFVHVMHRPTFHNVNYGWTNFGGDYSNVAFEI